jgi:hypothetical protein
MREVTCAVLAATLAAGSVVRAEDRTATAIVEEMRRALGGHAALDAVQTMRGVGVAIRALGELRVTGAVEIVVALPGSYLRTDRLKVAGLTSEVVTGLNGDTFLQRASGPTGIRLDPAAALDPGVRAVVVAGAARGARHDLIRLLLAFLGNVPGAALTFTAAGRAEAPEWTADVLQVEGADGFATRLFVDTVTRRPLMVAWEAPDTPGAIRRLTTSYSAPRADAPKVGAADLLNQAQSFVEHRLYFSEYRRVDGLTWPHRLRRTAGAEPIEDITFERLSVNPRLEPRHFDPDR